jgi:hypothetical protein
MGEGLTGDGLYVEPTDLRTIGNHHHAAAATCRDVAQPDTEWLESFIEHYGNAAYAFYKRAHQYMTQDRVNAWNSVADRHQSTGDVLHASAAAFENTDVDGGGHITSSGQALA